MTCAFLFPGQGSQFVGMGRDHIAAHPHVGERLMQASELVGEDLKRLMLKGPRGRLQQTDKAQVVIFVLSHAIWELLAPDLPADAVVAGHSLGQFTALVAAGGLEFETGLRLVIERGRLMHLQNRCVDGTMLAVIGPAADEIEAEIADLENCWIGNYNTPRQHVLSGHRDALSAAERRLRGKGARTTWLRVAGAYHTPLFQTAARRFARLLQGVRMHPLTIPLVANTSGRIIASAEEVRAELERHMTSPVRWTDSMRTIEDMRPDFIVEVGPGRVLYGLARQCSRDLHCLHTDTAGALAQAQARLRQGRSACASM